MNFIQHFKHSYKLRVLNSLTSWLYACSSTWRVSLALYVFTWKPILRSNVGMHAVLWRHSAHILWWHLSSLCSTDIRPHPTHKQHADTVGQATLRLGRKRYTFDATRLIKVEMKTRRNLRNSSTSKKRELWHETKRTNRRRKHSRAFLKTLRYLKTAGLSGAYTRPFWTQKNILAPTASDMKLHINTKIKTKLH